jgi:hypothetical protein
VTKYEGPDGAQQPYGQVVDPGRVRVRTSPPLTSLPPPPTAPMTDNIAVLSMVLGIAGFVIPCIGVVPGTAGFVLGMTTLPRIRGLTSFVGTDKVASRSWRPRNCVARTRHPPARVTTGDTHGDYRECNRADRAPARPIKSASSPASSQSEPPRIAMRHADPTRPV